MRIDQNRLRLAGVDNHQPVQGVESHEVAQDRGVGEGVRLGELRPLRHLGHRPSHRDLKRFGLGKREVGQKQAKAFVRKNPRVTRQKDDHRVLRPLLGLPRDLGKRLGECLPADILVGQDAEQPLLSLRIDAAVMENLADRLRVTARVGQPEPVVVSNSDRDDVNSSPFELAIVGDLQVGRAAVDRPLTAGHRVKPVDFLKQADFHGEFPRNWPLVILQPRRDRNTVLVKADILDRFQERVVVGTAPLGRADRHGDLHGRRIGVVALGRFDRDRNRRVERIVLLGELDIPKPITETEGVKRVVELFERLRFVEFAIAYPIPPGGGGVEDPLGGVQDPIGVGVGIGAAPRARKRERSPKLLRGEIPKADGRVVARAVENRQTRPKGEVVDLINMVRARSRPLDPSELGVELAEPYRVEVPGRREIRPVVAERQRLDLAIEEPFDQGRRLGQFRCRGNVGFVAVPLPEQDPAVAVAGDDFPGPLRADLQSRHRLG